MGGVEKVDILSGIIFKAIKKENKTKQNTNSDMVNLLSMCISGKSLLQQIQLHCHY